MKHKVLITTFFGNNTNGNTSTSAAVTTEVVEFDTYEEALFAVQAVYYKETIRHSEQTALLLTKKPS